MMAKTQPSDAKQENTVTHSRRALLKMGAMAGALASLVSGAGDAAAGAAEPQESRAAEPNRALNYPSEAYNGPWTNLRAVKEKKVIDFHTHCWETPYQGKTYADERAAHNEEDFKDYTEDLISSMDRLGVAQAALSPAFIPWEKYNSTSFAAHPDRFIKMTSVEVGDMTSENYIERFDPVESARATREQVAQGCRGIGEDGGNPLQSRGFGKYSVKDLKPYVDVILEYDLPVLIHCGWGVTTNVFAKNYSASWHWVEQMGDLASAYPDMKIIIGHTGGALARPDGYEALRLAFSFDNTYCEMSKAPVEIVNAAVKGIGAERVLFGSDFNRPEGKTYGPLNQHFVFQQWYNLNTIANADLTEYERDLILYKNARRLFKLDA
jgi:predicted TIM-barrel fold metal-dependent hydrolase